MLETGTKAPDFELPDQNGEMYKYGLAFTLLADPERKVIEAYDV